MWMAELSKGRLTRGDDNNMEEKQGITDMAKIKTLSD
jgi:hypothetical protein